MIQDIHEQRVKFEGRFVCSCGYVFDLTDYVGASAFWVGAPYECARCHAKNIVPPNAGVVSIGK